MYVKQRKSGLLMFALFSAVFLVTFYLYELPAAAVGYPVVICAVLSFVFFAADFCRTVKKHRRLSEISRMTAETMEHFPEARSQDDEDYRAVIEALRREHKDTVTQMALRYQDTVEYYTVWAHQIKTPIAAMRLILGGEDTPVSRQLSEELRRIEQYAEMVLAFIRLDSGTSDYVFREQELDPLIKESVKKFSGLFIRKKLRLCYEPTGATVLTDEKWLSFVIEQLLSNALKYTNEGSITIKLDENKTLIIKDTGIGIAPEDLPRVFEKSYTGYNGRADKKASGIGLYLCKRICDGLGHKISISSSESGTEVRICLARENVKTE